jgi:Cellulase (glycosyl hydrolase family 5)
LALFELYALFNLTACPARLSLCGEENREKAEENMNEKPKGENTMKDMNMTRKDFLGVGLGALMGAPSLFAQGAPLSATDKNNDEKKKHSSVKAIQRHRFGVNYTPTKNWFFFWNDFDAEAVARDLDAIAALGMDHFRIFMVWPYFQPNRTWVSPGHLNRLDQLMQLAAQRKLDVCISMLNGWIAKKMLPEYDEPGKFYTSATMFEAQALYFTEASKVLRGHANFLGFDIGNEMNMCWSTGKDTAAGDAWLDRIMTLAESLCPGQTHVNGVDHQPWFFPQTFSPEWLARRQPIVALHSWIAFTGATQRSGPLDPPCVKLAAGMAALARAFAGDPAKPIWIQEYGASPEWMDKKEIPRFIEATTQAAIDEGVAWFTWWASHDVDRRFELSSLEYDLGLITLDNKIKDRGQMFKSIAENYQGKTVTAISAPTLPTPKERTMESTWEWLLQWMNQ